VSFIELNKGLAKFGGNQKLARRLLEAGPPIGTVF
jgi:hypothetical protein